MTLPGNLTLFEASLAVGLGWEAAKLVAMAVMAAVRAIIKVVS